LIKIENGKIVIDPTFQKTNEFLLSLKDALEAIKEIYEQKDESKRKEMEKQFLSSTESVDDIISVMKTIKAE
jgi:hypothetical protein